jgi:hypothetical protein
MANAGWFRGPYLWQLGVPVLHVLLVCERRGEKWNVLGARDPARRYCEHAVEPRFADTMIAIDQAVAPGGRFAPTRSYSEALRLIRQPSKYADNAAKAGSAASRATKVW